MFWSKVALAGGSLVSFHLNPIVTVVGYLVGGAALMAIHQRRKATR